MKFPILSSALCAVFLSMTPASSSELRGVPDRMADVTVIKKLPNGKFCSENEDCESGICFGGFISKCMAKDKADEFDVRPLESPEDVDVMGSPEDFDAMGSVDAMGSRAKSENGEVCVKDNTCMSGNCYLYQCRPGVTPKTTLKMPIVNADEFDIRPRDSPEDVDVMGSVDAMGSPKDFDAMGSVDAMGSPEDFDAMGSVDAMGSRAKSENGEVCVKDNTCMSGNCYLYQCRPVVTPKTTLKMPIVNADEFDIRPRDSPEDVDVMGSVDAMGSPKDFDAMGSVDAMGSPEDFDAMGSVDAMGSRAKSENGEVCVKDNTCMSGNCYLYQCRPVVTPKKTSRKGDHLEYLRAKNGEMCFADHDCESDYCDVSFVCKAEPISYVPGKVEIGSPCGDNEDCKSGRCDWSLSHKCMAVLDDGLICNENSDCESQNCDHYFCKPFDTLPIGSDCEHHEQCESDRCDGLTGLLGWKCTEKGDKLDLCNEDNDCKSGKCSKWYLCE